MVTKEEYLKMIQEAYDLDNDEYFDLDDSGLVHRQRERSIEEIIEEANRIRDKIEKKNQLPNLNLSLDATNLKRDVIEKIVKTCGTITVGKFFIRATSNSPDTLNYDIYETMTKTASGFPCKMENRVNVVKDDRFHNREWVKLFHMGVRGKNIPFNTCVDIVKWLQAIVKLTPFL